VPAQWDHLSQCVGSFFDAFGILADGGADFKLAIVRQLKRIKSFKFKTTLREFEVTGVHRPK
jgi:hypothetical protein